MEREKKTSAALLEPYEKYQVEVDRAVKKPHQIEALVCSQVAWGDVSPLFYFGTSDMTLHCYVPNGKALDYFRSHTSYKRIFHKCAQFIDSWGVYLTAVDSKITLYTLPLQTNPQLDASSSSRHPNTTQEHAFTIEETKYTVLFAVHEEVKVVCCVTKQNELKVFDWTVNRSLQLRCEYALPSLLTSSPLSPSALPVQKMIVMSERMLFLLFKKEWCVVDLDKGKLVQWVNEDSGVSSPGDRSFSFVDGITTAIAVPQMQFSVSKHHQSQSDVMIFGKHRAFTIALRSDQAHEPRLQLVQERTLQYNVPPISVHFHHPFLLCEEQDKLVVYTLGPMRVIQTIPIKSIQAACSSLTVSSIYSRAQGLENSSVTSSFALLSPAFTIEILKMKSIALQAQHALKNESFSDVMALSELCPDELCLSEEEKRCLYAKYGLELFENGEFQKAMRFFLQSALSIRQVLSLYPEDLLPRGLMSFDGVNPKQRLTIEEETSRLSIADLEEFLSQRRPSIAAALISHSPGEEGLLNRLLALIWFLQQEREADLLVPQQGKVVQGLQSKTVRVETTRQRSARREEERGYRELVDTVLLKCLVLVMERPEKKKEMREALMLLVKSESNRCEIGETEVFFCAHKQFSALIAFYATRKLHRKTLELLEELERIASGSKNASQLEYLQSSDSYMDQISNYLRALDHTKAPLIFEFSRRVLTSKPALGISIFSDRKMSSPEDLIDPAQILSHLRSCQVQAKADDDVAEESLCDATDKPVRLPLCDGRFLAIEFLCRVIFEGSYPLPPRFHDEAVYLLLEAVNLELQNGAPSPPRDLSMALNSSATSPPSLSRFASVSARLTPRVSSQAGFLGLLRRKLLQLLEYPGALYHPERMLSRTPMEMVEERVALLARLGRHHEVLQLYALQIKDTTLAEAYCNRCYESHVVDSSIYSTLLRLYLRPPAELNSSSKKPDAMHLTFGKRQSTSNLSYAPASIGSEAIQAALNLLNRHAERVDVATVLELLPPNVPMTQLASFFRQNLENQLEKYRNGQVKRQLAKMENFRVRELLSTKKKGSVTIWGSQCCAVCGKKLGAGTLVKLPCGSLLHFSCQPKAS